MLRVYFTLVLAVLAMSSSKFVAERSRRSELQGPRPPPLMIHDNSHRIQKPQKKRQPVIIYVVSPKMIHVEASEFMALVQRLTGPDSATSSTTNDTAATPSSGNPRSSTSRSNKEKRHQFTSPLQVKAWPLNHSGSEGTAQKPQQHPSSSQSTISPATLFIHDFSYPTGGGALRRDSVMASHQSGSSWLHHGDFWSAQTNAALPSGNLMLGSPNYFDIFGTLSEH
uniref:VQ domain-containing protein n=1 Tax=Ananas comosus var. bracteatus TaxID=296719 RepID=A0A6V7QQ98_ANACO